MLPLAIKKPEWRQVVLLLTLTVLITVMIAPNLNLVPARYEPGDLIRRDIIITDNVALVDERSTEARRQKAVAEFAPIYDFDDRLRGATLDDVRGAFAQMRDALAEQSKSRTELLTRIRRNSLEQIRTLADLQKAREHMAALGAARNQAVGELGAYSELPTLTSEQALRVEKLRFELLALDALRISSEQTIEQLGKKLDQLTSEGTQRQNEWQRLQQGDDQFVAHLKTEFDKRLGITTEPTAFRVFYGAQFSAAIERDVLSLLGPLLERRIVSSREQFANLQYGIQLKGLESPRLERLENLDGIAEVAQVRAEADRRAQERNLAPENPALREAIIALAQKLIRPTLTANRSETERQKQDLIQSISPVFFNLKVGDVVARAGESATPQQAEIIRALNNYNLANPKYPQLIGSFLIVLLSLALIYQFIGPRFLGAMVGFSRLVLMAILILLTLGLAQLLLLIVPALTTVYDFIPPVTYNYLIPAALTSMLAGILLRFEVAVFLGVAVSLFLSVLVGNSLSFFLYGLMGSFIAAMPIKNYETRYALWQQGLRISTMNVLILVIVTLLHQQRMAWSLAYSVGAAAINGFGVAFLASTILPLFERVFDITTNLRLLELSNMNHPALKELAVRAPGTYHHSIVVGNLSESAAPGIRANPLLVRVASYYHDLGKMLCPLYFVENQSQKNYHDDLPPKTSTRIIVNHVKDGLELARQHKLGTAIIDIISQHHGDSLVRWFYHKAEQEQAELGEPVDEADFRYPGPKPQTKEAGLVMVADVTEAATRSVDDPSPDTIRELVQKLSTRIYMEGELDESGLTFNDLNYIEKVFTKMLLSIHHHRISYPEVRADTERRDPAPPEPPHDSPNPATPLADGRPPS